MREGNFCGDCGADSRGSCLCADAKEGAECEMCGGDGIVTSYGRDADDINEEECPDCGGLGAVDDDGNDPDDRPLPTEDRTGLKESPL